MKYVGETGQQLKDRLNNHRSDIATRKNTAISVHFNSPSHTISHLKITPLEQTTGDWQARKIREAFYINKLNTSYPNGLNNYPL